MSGLDFIFRILIAFQIKHFVADYPLQGKYMLGKFKPGWDFLGPLLSHCLVHAYLTFVIVWSCPGELFTWQFALQMAVLDFVIHFIMDRIKAGPKYLGRFKDMYDKKFWWSLGLDQMVHHLTHYLIVYLILRRILNV